MLASTRDVIREVHADGRQWIGALGTTWFWIVGALTLSLLPVIVKEKIGGGVDVEIAINLLFAIGVGAGSIGAAMLSHGPHRACARAVPAADHGRARHRRRARHACHAAATRVVPLSEFFTSALGVRIALEILVYSAAAGLFVVPIFAAVQAWAGEDRRARVVGAVNAMNYIGMVGGSVVDDRPAAGRGPLRSR